MKTNVPKLKAHATLVGKALSSQCVESKLRVSRFAIYCMLKDRHLVLVKLGKLSSGITPKSIRAMPERNKSLAESIVSSAQMPTIWGTVSI